MPEIKDSDGGVSGPPMTCDEAAWTSFILQMRGDEIRRFVAEEIGDPDEQLAAFDAIVADVVKRMQRGD